MEELWKDIEGYEGLYQVSNLGNVKVLDRVVTKNNGNTYLYKEKIRKLLYNKYGYLKIILYKNGFNKTFLVHRLVASAFLENPNNKTAVNHKNGRKDDNKLENLEWVTPAENTRHSFEIGLQCHGENSNRAVLTDDEVKIIKYGMPRLSLKETAEKYGVTKSTIAQIRSGRNWKHI